MRKVVEEGMRQWEMQCARTGRCQGLQLEEQEGAERDQPVAGAAGRAGPGFLGLAGYILIQLGFLFVINHLVDHHPAVV